MRHLILVFTYFHNIKLKNTGQNLILICILFVRLSFFEIQKSSARTNHSTGDHFDIQPVDIFVTPAPEVIPHPFSQHYLVSQERS